MKFRKIVKEDAREEWEDLKAHWTASNKPKMHDQFKAAGEWNKAHPELTCDRCGFTSRHKDFFGVKCDEILCDKCRREMANEARKPIKKSKWWFDIPGAKYIYHGDWSDPEVIYDGFSLNYWSIEEGLLAVYREEHPEDKNDKGFDDWMAAQGGKGGEIEAQLDNLVYAELGDNNVEDKEWLGIPDAYRIKEIYGQGDGEYVLYKDCLVDISDFDYYDKDYDDYFTYKDDPQGFEAYYIDKSNRGELIDQLERAVRQYR